MGERDTAYNPGIRDKDIWKAGDEYIEERQTQVTALLETALIISDIYSSEKYKNNIIVGQLPTGENVDITNEVSKSLIAVAESLSGELWDLDAITPEIEDLWLEVNEIYGDDALGENQEDDPPFSPPSLN